MSSRIPVVYLHLPASTMHCRQYPLLDTCAFMVSKGRALNNHPSLSGHHQKALQHTASRTPHKTVHRIKQRTTTAVLRNFTSHHQGAPRTERLVDSAAMFFSEVLNSCNTAYLDEICANDVVYCDSVWLPAPLKGRARLARYLNDLQHAYPDVLVQLHSISCCDDGETVMAHWTIRGSNLRDYGGAEPTGRSSAWSGVSVFRFDAHCVITSIRVYREPTEEERAFYMGWDSL